MSSFTVNLKTAFQNTLYDISLVPTMIELNYKANKYWKNPEKAMEDQKKKNEKAMEKQEAKKAKAQAKAEDRDGLSERITDEIAKIAKGNVSKTSKLVLKAKTTANIINYALFYISNMDASWLNVTEDEKCLVNSIAVMFDFPEVYKDRLCLDLDRFDPTSEKFLENGKFFLIVEEIESNKKNELFMRKVQKRKEQILKEVEVEAAEKEHPEDDEPEITDLVVVDTDEEKKEETSEESKEEIPVEEKKIVPETEVDENGNIKIKMKVEQKNPDENFIKPHFVNEENPVYLQESDPQVSKQGFGIDDQTFAMFESYLGNCGVEHRYERSREGNLYLFVDKGSYEVFYLLDEGSYLGAPAILMITPESVNGGALFVPLTCMDIIKKALVNTRYTLSDEEIKFILDTYYLGTNLNRYFDLTSVEDYLAKASKEEKQNFANKLDFIYKKVVEQTAYKEPNVDYPRFRFESMKSLDEFTVVSDVNTDTKLAWVNIVSGNICNGLKYEVTGNKVVQTYGTSVLEFQI